MSLPFFFILPHQNWWKFLGFQGWVEILMITLVYSKRVSVRNNLLHSVYMYGVYDYYSDSQYIFTDTFEHQRWTVNYQKKTMWSCKIVGNSTATVKLSLVKDSLSHSNLQMILQTIVVVTLHNSHLPFSNSTLARSWKALGKYERYSLISKQ